MSRKNKFLKWYLFSFILILVTFTLISNLTSNRSVQLTFNILIILVFAVYIISMLLIVSKVKEEDRKLYSLIIKMVEEDNYETTKKLILNEMNKNHFGITLHNLKAYLVLIELENDKIEEAKEVINSIKWWQDFNNFYYYKTIILLYEEKYEEAKKIYNLFLKRTKRNKGYLEQKNMLSKLFDKNNIEELNSRFPVINLIQKRKGN